PVPVVNARSRNFFCAGAVGAAGTRSSLRPLLFEGDKRCKPRAKHAARMWTHVFPHSRPGESDDDDGPKSPYYTHRKNLPPPTLAHLVTKLSHSKTRQGSAHRSCQSDTSQGDQQCAASSCCCQPVF